MAVHPKKKAREMGGLVYLVLTFLLYLSMFSYRSLDPSFDVSSPWKGVQNLAGPVGAWVADVLFQALGLTAVILPLPLLFVGSKKLLGRSIEYPWLKTLGFVGIVFSLCCGLTLVEPTLPEWLDFRAGGVLGILGSQVVVGWFNRSGAIVVLVAILLLSLMMTTRFSIEGLLNWLGARRPLARLDLRTRWQRWRKRRRDRKTLRQMKKRESQVVAQAVPRQVAFGGAVGSRTSSSGRSRSPLAQDSMEGEPTGGLRAPVLTTPPAAPEVLTGASDGRPARVPTEKNYQFPSLDFLQDPPDSLEYDEKELVERAHKLTTKCAEFGVLGQVQQIQPGPVVTTFEFKPDPGVKYSRITNLSDDLCLALRAESIRIDRIPGKNTVGIEVPNSRRRIIFLKEILASAEFQRAPSPLTLALGQLINGATSVVDLDRMPHLLIAGSTGSGKSVGLNCMVCSILFKAGPNEVRFIMVDPKRLELGLYEDIPHLLTPIVTDPKKAANALRWAVREMEDRYKILAQQGVRNIAQYNAVVRENGSAQTGEDEEELSPLPNIVILVDELADLMMTAGKDVETAVTRLAQMARAVGIHLILATQRPSVDVITGLIKANFPSRLSYRVSSKIDSRTILDSNGAEQLLGMGDMLFLSPETARLVRVHGAYISEKEIGRIVKFLREQGEPDYQEEILIGEEEESDSALVDIGDLDDALYQEAANFVVETRKASTSLLQRRFRIGYGRAARLLDMMEHEGLIGPSEGTKARDVLVPPGYFEEIEGRN